MDGLECSEVFFSYVKRSNDIFRIDSFYYSKEFLGDENSIDAINTISFKELNADIKSFGAYSLNNDIEYIDDGIPFIRGVNIKNGRVNFSNMIYISEKSHRLLWKSEVTSSTILLSMSGTIGDVALARDNWDYPINSNQDIAKIILNQNYNPYLACAFLLSKYGQNFMLREARGSVQQHVYLSQIETLKLPVFSDDFVEVIERLMLKSDNDYDLSEKEYIESTNLLLSSLNIKDFTISEQPVSVKSLSESFVESGRLDAEYYQPKYDDLLNVLIEFQTKPLGGDSGIVNIKKSIEPGSALYQSEGIPFVRVSDVSKFRIAEPEIHLPEDVVPNAFELYPKRNTILFSKDGSVGIAYKLERDAQSITSGALLHLSVRNEAEVLPDYLTLVLNSIIVQLQAERDSSGAIIQHWKPSEIEKVIIPILDMGVQEKIANKVQESFALRQQSEQLLENAKRAVEIAIEQGEETAMEWLKDKVE